MLKSFALPTQYCIIPTDSDRDTPNKLFLGGIPTQATEKELEGFFSQFGKVKDVRIVTDRVTAECKGYGFVTFDENENIDALLEKKVVRMNGKKIRIRRAIRRHGSQFDHINSSYQTKSCPQFIPSPPQTLLKPVSGIAQQTPPFNVQMLTPPPSPEPSTKSTSTRLNTQFMMNPIPQMEPPSHFMLPPLQIPLPEVYMTSYPCNFNPNHLSTIPSQHTQPFIYIPQPPYNSYPMHHANPYQMAG